MEKDHRYLLEIIFFLLLAGLSVAFLQLVRPFLLSAFLALVLANIFHRPYRSLLERTQRPRLAAAATTGFIVVVVMIPVLLVTTMVTAEIVGAVEAIRQNWDSESLAALLPDLLSRAEGIPVLGTAVASLPEIDVAGTVREVASTSGEYLLRVSQRSIGNVTAALLNFLVMLLLVFFFLVDGPRILHRFRAVAPISNREIDEMSRELFSTTSATLISTLIIGLIEGALATVLFLVFRLPNPFLWGVITMILSMIPLIGTNLVLIPAGVLTVVTGRPVAGVLIIGIGIAGVATTQNVLRPKLVGDRTGLHPALALLATIGGIAWLGLIGFLIGPVVASLFIVIWRLFAARYHLMLAGKDAP